MFLYFTFLKALSCVILQEEFLRFLRPCLVLYSRKNSYVVWQISNETVLYSRKNSYVVWQISNETGNAVHEPTMLLPPPSHGR